MDNEFKDFDYNSEYDFSEEVRQPDKVKVERLIDYNPMPSLDDLYENDIQRAIQNSLLYDIEIQKAIELSQIEFEYEEERNIKELALKEEQRLKERQLVFNITKQQLNRLMNFDNTENKIIYELILDFIDYFEKGISWDIGFTEEELRNIRIILSKIRIPIKELTILEELFINL